MSKLKIRLYSTFSKLFVVGTKDDKKGFIIDENLTEKMITRGEKTIKGDVFFEGDSKIGAFIEYCRNPSKYNGSFKIVNNDDKDNNF